MGRPDSTPPLMNTDEAAAAYGRAEASGDEDAAFEILAEYPDLTARVAAVKGFDADAEAAFAADLADVFDTDQEYMEWTYPNLMALSVDAFVPQNLTELVELRGHTLQTLAHAIHLSEGLVERLALGEVAALPEQLYRVVAEALMSSESELRSRLIEDANLIDNDRLNRWAARYGVAR